ncbi:MAG: tetratricopeptide repeat protein [Acidobacteria bacterium]|nr:tetratricopeptide repeat protein [Acidobacteriota bacterium]
MTIVFGVEMMQDKHVLDSWKEIAGYLSRTIKTCHRWENDLDLPIRRLDGSPKARVFAYKEELDSWLEEKLNERELPRKRPFFSTIKSKKLFIPLLVVFAAVVFVLFIWSPWSQKISFPISSDKPSLAVMYFKNSTGDPSLDIWRNALAESLITDLSQSKYINVLSADRLFSIMRKFDLLETQNYGTEELKKIASEGQTSHILLGNFTRAGDIFRIETTLQDINSGEAINSERVEGTGEESFFTMVDELTRRIKSSFYLSPELIASDIDRDIGEITTSSPEALKYYTESAFKGVYDYDKEDSRRSISLLEKAIAVDPDFAMAYRRLGVAYWRLGNSDKRRECLQRAMELSDRVSDRELYIIQGSFYTGSEKTWDKAIDVYNKLLDLYPDDPNGNYNLPIIYSQIGKIDKAIEISEKARQYNPKNSALYSNEAMSYFSLGLYDKAEEILKYYEKNISENDGRIKKFLAWSFLFQKKYDLALAEIDRSISLSPSNQRFIAVKGDIYLFKGDFINAEREYNKSLEKNADDRIVRVRLGALYLLKGKFEDSNVQIKKGLELQNKLGRDFGAQDFNLQLAYGYLRTGNKKKALELCNEALSYAIDKENPGWQRWALYFKGLTFIDLKSMDETQRTADELKRSGEESPNEITMQWYYHLMGLIELEKKSISKAEEYFKKAFLLMRSERSWSHDLHALFIEPLALAYYKSGDLEKSREEYEKIISLTYGRFHYGDIYAKSFYMLGKICEEKGWAGKAIEHYEKFLDLWKDADPGLIEVDDAKKRLAVISDNHTACSTSSCWLKG